MSAIQGINRYEYFKTIGGGAQSGGCYRRNVFHYMANIRSTPQVMFKTVKSGFASGFIGLSAQMNYVLGKATRIIDPSGEVDGQRELDTASTKDIASRWADGFEKTAKDGKHTMHMVASFPAGTNIGAVEYIIRDTCEELISQGRARFEYIAAVHNDTKNPHGHIIVNRRNAEGEWFYLARDHEFNYDRFKDSLVHHGAKYGIELNNSSRLSRGFSAYAKDSRNTAMRGIEGKMLDCGEAPFKGREKGSFSFFITLDTKFGERTVWGVGLSPVLAASRASRGDTIRIKHEGKRSVQVPTECGQTITVHRNDWRIGFNGKEYGDFDQSSETAGFSSEDSSKLGRRVILLSDEISKYENFAESTGEGFASMAVALRGAASALNQGKDVSCFRDYVDPGQVEVPTTSEAIRSAFESYTDTVFSIAAKIEAKIEKLAHEKASERPSLEERSFKHYDQLHCMVQGVENGSLKEDSSGSIYSDAYRHKIASRTPVKILSTLADNGIDQDEFNARMKIETLPFGLEQHWVSRDRLAIAKHHGLDLETPSGSDDADERAAELQASLIEASDRHEKWMEDATGFLESLASVAGKPLPDELSDKIVKGMNLILGEDSMDELHRANSGVFADRGFAIDEWQAFDVLVSYSEALRVQGYDTEPFNKAIDIEEQRLLKNEEIARLKEEEALTEQARAERSEDDGESWSL
ncbi:relaxase/mobilization nuclease domain-containing protein [Brucella pituitosa]|uniref:Relaxase/mobilization nuclease domain-containing protein n=1 Tax=Brucella pituitosa TaxID=571256 RepID=A0A643EUU0_9HYPH|nr:relaxase/mobilization nuclease domain-containing protein [Brucella pituitosa]KAB0566118.1 relaxase/mobilization nuclease domain-containing protein [Brucella pituitosa]